MGDNDLSYCELRAKEVVNATDGKRMGRIVDILFSRHDGTVSGIVVPFCKRSVFSKNQDIFIPWRCVQKIGEDVILVCLTVEADGRVTCGKKEPPPPPPPPPPPHRHGQQEGRERRERCDDACSEQSCGCSEDGEVPYPDCDFRCEKCMLFDCAYRWSHTN